MSYESFIAKRYLRSGRFCVSVSTLITMLGVTLGVGTVCFVMSMHNGFEHEIRSRLLGTTSHITIFPLSGATIENYDEVVAVAEKVENVLAASPFIYYKAAASSPSYSEGVIVRGIDPEAESKTSDIVASMKVGDYDFTPIVDGDDTIPAVILGSGLADKLGVFLGEAIVMYTVKGADLTRLTRPRVARFYVSGIFETGMHEFDAYLSYISLKQAQKFFRTGDAATAVHLKLTDIYLADETAPKIDSALAYRFDVVPWNILHKNLFSWIEIEKLVLFLGFSLIVLVAAFSIISTLVMLTMEKRPEIAILKTIGSTPGSIKKIFVYQGVAIALIGIVSGWFLAFSLAFLQNKFEIISLPPDIYFISHLPIQVNFIEDFLVVGGITLIVCFLASLYPAGQAAKLTVIDILRK
ncbi:MAG: ABC transporter permease [candidate division Zixibacteria bacterium]